MRTLLLALALLAAAPALATEPPAPAVPATPPATGGRTVAIQVTENGFEPREIRVRRGVPVTLSFSRRTDRTCITAIDIPDEGVKELQLPLGKTVAVTITPKQKGVEKFHCSAMAMGNGRIVVED